MEKLNRTPWKKRWRNPSAFCSGVSNLPTIADAKTLTKLSKDLVEKINSLGKKALHIPDFEQVVQFLKTNVNENDIILTLGAGTVTEIGPMLLKE